MGRFTSIQPAIFRDPEYLRLSQPARAVWVWAIVCEHSNYSGIFRCDISTIAHETGITARRLEDALAELGEADKVIFRDGWVWDTGKVRWARPRSDQTAKSAWAAWADCSDPVIKAGFVARYGSDWLAEHAPEDASEWAANGADRANIDRGSENGSGTGKVEVQPKFNRSSITSPSSTPSREDHVGSTPTSASLTASRSVARTREDEPPSDLPAQLRPLVDPVLAALSELAAESRAAKRPTALSVGRLLRDLPHKDWLPVARAHAAYWLDQPASRRPKAPVQSLRRWADKEPDVIRKTPIEETRYGEYVRVCN